MSSEAPQIPVNGGSQNRGMRNLLAWAASHADDYALQELVKLAALGAGGSDRAVFPYGARGQNGGGIVQVGASAATPIVVMPFRAMIGPRIAYTGTPPSPGSPLDPVIATAAELAYRDARSAVFAVANGIGSTGYQIPSSAFATNALGHPRWDLVYAAVYLDQPSSAATIIYKPPLGGTPGPTSANPSYLTGVGSPPQAVTGATPAILVATGVSAIPPTSPTLPADDPAAGIYYVPLAAVLVPYPFTSGTTAFVTKDILILCPSAEVAEVSGGINTGPVQANLVAPGARPAWGSTQRPGYVLPSSMVGGVKKTFLLDATTAAGSAPIGNAAVVDASIDWRKRFFRVTAFASQSTPALFACDPNAQGLGPGSATFVPGAQSQSATATGYAVQPLSVLCGNGTNAASQPESNVPGAFTVPTGTGAGSPSYYVPLENLTQGATLHGVTFRVTAPSGNAGTSTIQLWKVQFSTGTATQIGSTTTVIAGTLVYSAFSSPSALNLTEVVDLNQYGYYAVIGADSGAAIVWSQAGAYQTITTQLPASATCEGQSFDEDSQAILGSELGTGSGAGVAALFSPTPAGQGYLPQMGAVSQIALYVDLSTGNLMLNYVGTPGVRIRFGIEATGAMDNV